MLAGATRNHIKTNHLSVIDHSMESGTDTTQSILERTFSVSNNSSRLAKNLMSQKAKSRHPALGNLYATMSSNHRAGIKSLNTARNDRDKFNDMNDSYNKNNNVVFP